MTAGRDKTKENTMFVDILTITPNNAPSKNGCYDCIGCVHLKSITVDDSHEAYIECDLNEE